ncbi:MAG: DUF4421 domain-containing protein [Bacteroidota bacterium]
MKNVTFILTFFLFPCFVFSQKDEGFHIWKKNFKIDTSSIVDLSDNLGIYLYTSSKQNSLELKDLSTKKKLKLQPNGQTNLGFGFNYKWIKLGVAYGLPFMNQDDEKYGETKRLDLQLNIFTRLLGIDAHLQHYTGFYLSNPDDYTDSIYTTYPYLANMQTTSLGMSAYYFFNNKKFSYKAVFTRNQIQKKSAGSFILGGFYNLNYAYSPNGFVTEELADSLKSTFPLHGFVTNVMGLSVGYTYTLVFLKKMFLNASLVPGIGIRFSEIIKTSQSEVLLPALSGSITLRFSLGYEGKHFYAGLKSITAVNSYNYESVDISSSTGNFQFYVGKRFKLKKRTNKK